MKKILLGLVITLMTFGSAQAFYKTEKFMSDFGNATTKGERQYLLNYLEGIVRGVVATNVLSAFENGKRLFCPPGKVPIDARRVLLLLPDFMVEAQLGNTKWKGITGDDPLALSVPQLLVHTYPCN